MSPADDISVDTVITSHQNVDFDAFAAAVGVSKLYPEGQIVFTGSMNPNVREFANLHGEDLPLLALRSLDVRSVRRLIVVDTAECARLGELGALCGQEDVEVMVFDHHAGEHTTRPDFVTGENWVLSDDGAQATSILHILRERDVAISPLEATIFALGIHEDTGSLTYPRTTVRDAEMLAIAMRLGASQALVEHFLHSPLSADQRALLLRMMDEVRAVRVRGQEVHTITLVAGEYVDGLSVLAHKVMDLLNAEVLLQAITMEDRVFVTGRSRSPAVDVGSLLGTVGGGGHAQASSAVIRNGDPQEVMGRLLDALEVQTQALPTAADIMSRPVRFIDADTSVADALAAAQRYGHSGISVKEGGRVAGIVARRDLDKAIRHGLGHAPVKGVMTRNVVYAHESATIEELRQLMVETNVGRLPIVADDAYERAEREGGVRVEDVVGITTRTDVLAAFQGSVEEEGTVPAGSTCTIRPLDELPFFGRILREAQVLSDDFGGVYLVGGFVRDLLLERPNADVDIAVEGDGIEFARRLARSLGGRIRAHRKFRTAVVLLPPEILGQAPEWLVPSSEPFHVDVATTRTEFYDYPAALPTVEHASIRQDLFRRDFTVNAMAVSLKGDAFGLVIDFFGGFRDLEQQVLRVLHNLSFIEDPTRIFRAIRYENRYGFRMDEQTHSLARACVDMHLVGDLSSARLRDELIALLSEQDVTWTLHRLYELGVARQVHPKLATGERTVELIRRLDELVAEFGLEGEVVPWRLRLAAVTRNMTHEELFFWTQKLKLRHTDSQVLRKGVVMAPRLREQLVADGITDWEVYEVLNQVPEEAIVFTLAQTPEGAATSRMRRYLGELRHRSTLGVNGADIIALGVGEGPRVGRILDELRRLRVEGCLDGREVQLQRARRLAEEEA